MIHQPWLADDLPITYPSPIVDEASTRQAAVKRLYAIRKRPEHQRQAECIVKKHASRRRRPKPASEQLQLDLNDSD